MAITQGGMQNLPGFSIMVRVEDLDAHLRGSGGRCQVINPPRNIRTANISTPRKIWQDLPGPFPNLLQMLCLRIGGGIPASSNFSVIILGVEA